MALSPPLLTIQLDTSSDCKTINLLDLTGVYSVDGNTTGYGLPNGPTVNDVTTVTIVVTYNSLATTLTYVFTISSGVITACTLSLNDATPVTITGNLTNTAWPFVEGDSFNLFDDYGVVIPTFIDDVYTVTYDIEGVTPELFEFTTQEDEVVVCASQLCVNQKFADIDWSCECSADKAKQALLGEAYINQVVSSVALGDLSAGLNALEKVTTLCGTASGGCGC
jgi:hypothetical protein